MSQYERAVMTAVYYFYNGIEPYRAKQLGFDDAADLRLTISAIAEKEYRETGENNLQAFLEMANTAISRRPITRTHCPTCDKEF